MSEIFDVLPKEMLLPQTEMRIQEKKKHEFKYIGSQRKVPGHTLFSLNLKTGEIKKADIQKCNDVDFRTGMPVHRDKIVVEPHCVYRQALNRKNFIKILLREGIIRKRMK